MDWSQGSFINQYYKSNENLSGRSLVEDVEMYMVDHFQGFLRWYDNVLILELKFKLLNESKNYYKTLTDDERFRASEKVVNKMVRTYNNRYRDVERHVAHCIEQHKKCLERFRGYGHYRYIGYMV
jgi:hypothetical protein